MFTYYLKFESEKAAASVIFKAEGKEKTFVYPNTDVIGEIVRVSNSTDPKNIITEKSAGWHVNIYSDVLIPALEKYKVAVTSPVRVIA